MKGKFVPVFVVGLLTCIALFLLVSQKTATQTVETFRRTVAKTAASIAEQKYERLTEEECSEIKSELSVFDENVSLFQAVSKSASPTNLPTEPESIVYADFLTLPETEIQYEDICKLPKPFVEALRTSLIQRTGVEFYSRLAFGRAVKFSRPVSGISFDLFSRKLPEPVFLLAVFSVDYPVDGVTRFEGQVALNENLEIIDSEFPDVIGGFSNDNFLSVEAVMKNAKKAGFPHVHNGSPTMYYLDGKIILRASTERKVVSKDGLHRTEQTIAKFDMKTGEMVGEPFVSKGIIEHFSLDE